MKGFLTGLALGLIAPVVAFLVLAFFGRLPVHATATPSWIESAVAGRALDARLARQAAGLKNPLRGTQDVLLVGMKLYRDDCAGCHGESGKPSQWGSKNLYPQAPQFADEPPDLSAAEMFVAVKHGIRYTGMGGFKGLVKDDDIWHVVTFLSQLKSLPPDVAKAWTTGP